MIRNKNDSGWIAVFVALSLVMLCGFVALAVDVGSFLSARTSAQRAADAGALAGALTYVINGDATPPPTETTARDNATKVAASNQIMGANIPAGEITVEFPASRRVQVTITHNAPIFFAKVLGIKVAPIKAEAIAEASLNPMASECVKPLFIPNTIHLPINPCDGCVGSPQILIDGSGQVTDFGREKIGKGHYYINVKGANESLGQQPPGKRNVFATTFSNDTQSGTTQFGQNILECPSGARIACNNSYPLKSDPGANLYAEAFNQFTSLVNANGSPDNWVNVGQYRGANGNIYNTSHQLITVPMFDVCGIPHFCDDANNDGVKDAILLNPNMQIKVVGFARMLARFENGKLTLDLAGLSGCGSLTADPKDAGPYGYPVRLVHN
jgi:hypothetical protein